MALALVAGLGACASPSPSMGQCAPPAGDASLSAGDLGSLPGTYVLTLVRDEGVGDVDSATGRLVLRPSSPSMRAIEGAGGEPRTDVAVPYFGSVRGDFVPLGVTDVGPLDSDHEARPGALVLVRTDPPSALIRLGAEVNQRGRLLFDGGYFVLEVARVDRDGFAGRWRSAAGIGSMVSGHFCAVRAEPE